MPTDTSSERRLVFSFQNSRSHMGHYLDKDTLLVYVVSHFNTRQTGPSFELFSKEIHDSQCGTGNWGRVHDYRILLTTGLYESCYGLSLDKDGWEKANRETLSRYKMSDKVDHWEKVRGAEGNERKIERDGKEVAVSEYDYWRHKVEVDYEKNGRFKAIVDREATSFVSKNSSLKEKLTKQKKSLTTEACISFLKHDVTTFFCMAAAYCADGKYSKVVMTHPGGLNRVLQTFYAKRSAELYGQLDYIKHSYRKKKCKQTTTVEGKLRDTSSSSESDMSPSPPVSPRRGLDVSLAYPLNGAPDSSVPGGENVAGIPNLRRANSDTSFNGGTRGQNARREDPLPASWPPRFKPTDRSPSFSSDRKSIREVTERVLFHPDGSVSAVEVSYTAKDGASPNILHDSIMAAFAAKRQWREQDRVTQPSYVAGERESSPHMSPTRGSAWGQGLYGMFYGVLSWFLSSSAGNSAAKASDPTSPDRTGNPAMFFSPSVSNDSSDRIAGIDGGYTNGQAFRA